MRVIRIAVSVLLVACAAAHASPSDELRRVKVDCQLLKSWGDDTAGKPWLRFDMSCSVPDELAGLMRQDDPARAIRQLSDPGARFAAATVFAAQGRFHLLPAPERARYVLELARRENEPFASTQIGFVFGRKPWWERKGTSPAVRPLGNLAAPWERGMTPVIRAYLLPGIKHRPVSTLAVYLCTLMGDKLDPAIIPDLQRVKRLRPGSFEAQMADTALARIAGKSTPGAR